MGRKTEAHGEDSLCCWSSPISLVLSKVASSKGRLGVCHRSQCLPPPPPLHHINSSPFVKEQMEVGGDTISCPHTCRQQNSPHDAQGGPWRIRGMASCRTTADGAQALTPALPTLCKLLSRFSSTVLRGLKTAESERGEKIPKGQ